MDKFLIKGPNTLNGTIKIGGAKNAVLPLMTACIIHPGEYVLNNVPILRDTITMAKLLEMVGAKVEINGNSFCTSYIMPGKTVELSEYFTFEVPGHKFMPSYRNKSCIRSIVFCKIPIISIN